MIIYRNLCLEELNRELFNSFQRTQNVTKCWRKYEGKWIIKDCPFTDDWTEDEYSKLIEYITSIILEKGFAAGAFIRGKLKGFVTVETRLFGTCNQYMDLTNIHVSQDMRRKGIGKELFLRAKAYAAAHGAKKLYISAHSAVESQAFYRALGCVEAEEYNDVHVNKEPFDCQLECCTEDTINGKISI